MKLPHPFVEPTQRRIRVRLGGTVVADSQRAQLLVQYGPGGLPTYFVPLDDVGPDGPRRRVGRPGRATPLDRHG